MSFQYRRRALTCCEIERCNFRPGRYYYEIHNQICAICLENMNIFSHIWKNGFTTGFKGCKTCSFWSHKHCSINLTKCPQCRINWN